MLVTAVLALTLGFALLAQPGCAEVVNPSWHQKFDWKAEDYFDDPKVIALCRAIEANDLEEIDRLVANGADVNTKGKGNMTPLLWAFPDNKPERFKKILEHGGDPNVVFESDFNTRMRGIVPGDSVTYMACGTVFPKYFDYVFKHGGDPNLWHPTEYETPVFGLIRGPAKEKARKLRRLIELEMNLDANIDNAYTGYSTPVRTAITCFGQYDLALTLLEAGADYKSYKPNRNSRLIHLAVGAERRLPYMTPEQKADYKKLINWLEAHGESVELARQDKERWKSWAQAGIYKEMMAKEVAERKAREAREKAAAEKEAKAEDHETDEPKEDE